MRSQFHFACTIALAGLICLSSATHVEAQSLFQSLFGNIFKSSPAKKKSRAPVAAVPSLPPGSSSRFQSNGYARYLDQQSQRSFSSGGYYRTVCVRPCDGYYFPISSSASRRQFRKDAKACSSRCGGGKLYYLPKNSDNVAGMVDLTGRRYDQLEAAFAYRKKLIDGCACRAMPWSAAERARHNRYAYAEMIRKINEKREQQLRQMALQQQERLKVAAQAEADARGEQVAGAPKASPVVEGVAPTRWQADDVEILAPPTTIALESETGQSEIHALSSIQPAAISVASIEATSELEQPAAPVVKKRQPATKKTRRSRKKLRTRRKTVKQAGWGFGGSNKYSWPGDR